MLDIPGRPSMLRALSLCACRRHYPGAATGGPASLIRPAVSAFPDRVVGSACASSVSRLTQRSLTLRPAHSRCHRIPWPASRRLQPFRYLHDCSGCFRLEHFAGWDSHPLESAAFARRTPTTSHSVRLPRAPFNARLTTSMSRKTTASSTTTRKTTSTPHGARASITRAMRARAARSSSAIRAVRKCCSAPAAGSLEDVQGELVWASADRLPLREFGTARPRRPSPPKARSRSDSPTGPMVRSSTPCSRHCGTRAFTRVRSTRTSVSAQCSARAGIALQKHAFGPDDADGIVGPNTAGALDIEWTQV